ncbi:hypothetical protein EJ08DRAFT_657088 [Tothia fuscella]|uniref:Zn(2)-C6 fungal-type domain-containing protein n=1 Tax=Tothia fuscella TaxID=1048955 RepID=A0A9P4P1D5_9PEZI|nr:hypothetical protein EJ08DRAFT_657088 [Tothia fuscella]
MFLTKYILSAITGGKGGEGHGLQDFAERVEEEGVVEVEEDVEGREECRDLVLQRGDDAAHASRGAVVYDEEEAGDDEDGQDHFEDANNLEKQEEECEVEVSNEVKGGEESKDPVSQSGDDTTDASTNAAVDDKDESGDDEDQFEDAGGLGTQEEDTSSDHFNGEFNTIKPATSASITKPATADCTQDLLGQVLQEWVDENASSSPISPHSPSLSTPRSSRDDSLTESSPITPPSKAQSSNNGYEPSPRRVYRSLPAFPYIDFRHGSCSPRKELITIGQDVLPGDFFDKKYGSHVSNVWVGRKDESDRVSEESSEGGGNDEEEEEEELVVLSLPGTPIISESLNDTWNLETEQGTPCPVKSERSATRRIPYCRAKEIEKSSEVVDEEEEEAPIRALLPVTPTMPESPDPCDLDAEQDTPCPVKSERASTSRIQLCRSKEESSESEDEIPKPPVRHVLRDLSLKTPSRLMPILGHDSDDSESGSESSFSYDSDESGFEPVFDFCQTTPPRKEIYKHIDFSNPLYVRKYNLLMLQRPCLQCVIKNLPCDQGLPGCSRCIRAGQEHMCLVQRDLGIDEKARLGFIHLPFVALARRGESDELWNEKLKLEEELLELLQERCDRQAWVLPVNDGRMAGYLADNRWDSRAYEVDEVRGREWKEQDWHGELQIPL